MKKIRERSCIRAEVGGGKGRGFSGEYKGNFLYPYRYGKGNSEFFDWTGGLRRFAFIVPNPKTTTIIIPSEFT